ncbi:pyridoxamine 5'-phosphate oxidase [Salaquimonas pukyongi]|uniref:pyridoxamine 5'-phosphate oxidase n=1 Tax=Salaquimonas pukyongi TaxID=2712698 RepID=UPI0012EC1708|nr:pyridoxamine 5'-phosphate oxidase [Salaquimonas pukyongi]
MANSRNMAESSEPFRQFAEWLALAEKSEPNDPTAMSLATVDAQGMPNVRMVLMRRWDERGIVFFTNFESQKGSELQASGKAAANFHWKSQRKQVRFRGPVEVVSDAEADEYFFSRPRGSRIGAHASKQSRPLESRFALEKAVAVWSAKFGVGEVPRPGYWSGFRIKPVSIEFWSDGQFRLHDRVRFDRDEPEGDWQVSRLYP